jgi:hypothetical protein
MSKRAAKMCQLVAIRTRSTKLNAWMPARAYVQLTGESRGVLLMLCGWSAEGTEHWPERRLRANFKTITKDWHELYGKTWKLEIQ